jgi:hypothetical protein
VDTSDWYLRVRVAVCSTIQLGEKGVVLPSLRFIRYAKILVLTADISTLACAVLVIGWQAFIFYRDGSWQTVPLSLVFSAQEYRDMDLHSTGSIGQSGAINFADTVLQLPIITVLLLAAAFLTAFCLWLYKTEKGFAE